MPRVRVGGQLYFLTLDNTSLSLQQVSSVDVMPYVYPYSVLSGVFPTGNEYYEPCIKATINYDTGDTAVLMMVFESEEERNSVVSKIQYYAERTFSEGSSEKADDSPESYKSGENYGENFEDSDFKDYMSHNNYESSSSDHNPYSRQTFDEYKYSQGSLSLIEKISGFLRYPGETFSSVTSDELKSGIIYAFLMLLMFSVVNVFISAVIASAISPENTIYGVLLNSVPELVRLILEYFIFGALCVLAYGLLVFFMTKIMRQEFHLAESLQTTLYSTTPLGTIGLIPLFGVFIAPIWMVFLQYKGLYDCLDSDPKCAAVSAFIPALIMLLIFYYIVVSGEVAFI
ncbi:MAG: YIP1 family protein [Methanomicrobiaceae archaeon]|nr:YIP1 family protein [Methanomicrobiaceae archaeon]